MFLDFVLSLKLTRPRSLIFTLNTIWIYFIWIYYNYNTWSIAVTLSTTITTISLQILANLWDTYSDFCRNFKEPTTNELQNIIKLVLIFSIIVLVNAPYLIYKGGIIILIIGVFSVVALFNYTRLSLIGLGEVLAFVFWGPVSYFGISVLLEATCDYRGFMLSAIPGGASALVMYANNLRDRIIDANHKKFTLALRLKQFAVYFIFLLIAVFIIMAMKAANLKLAIFSFFYFFSFYRLWAKIIHTKGLDEEDFVKLLKITTVYLLMIALFFTFLSYTIS